MTFNRVLFCLYVIVLFWIRPRFIFSTKIDEAILHRLKFELNAIDIPFLRQYNQVDIVFSRDHGAGRFWAVIKLNLQIKDDITVEPYSVVIHVGNVDCKKDTRKILEKTVGPQLNESLQLIVGKKYHSVARTIIL
jgi:hypothetical protein